MTRSGFLRVEAAGSVVMIAEDYRDELEALGLGEPGALERWREAAPSVAGGRARGWRIELRSGRVIHLREMAHGGLLRHWTGRRFLRLARATANLEVAAALSAKGIPVPAPVLLHARRHGPFWRVALANEFLEDSLSGGSFLAGRPGKEREIIAARRAGASTRAFHDAGASHPDLHVDNLLVRQDAERIGVMIIDLDGVRIGDPPSTARRRVELMRLSRSLAKHDIGPEARKRCTVAFFDAYVGANDGLRAALLAPFRPWAFRGQRGSASARTRCQR